MNFSITITYWSLHYINTKTRSHVLLQCDTAHLQHTYSTPTAHLQHSYSTPTAHLQHSYTFTALTIELHRQSHHLIQFLLLNRYLSGLKVG